MITRLTELLVGVNIVDNKPSLIGVKRNFMPFLCTRNKTLLVSITSYSIEEVKDFLKSKPNNIDTIELIFLMPKTKNQELAEIVSSYKKTFKDQYEINFSLVR